MEIELIINHVYVVKPSIKIPEAGGSENFYTGAMCQKGGTPQLHRDRNSCTQDLSRPCPVYFFICCSSVSFITSFINKPVNVIQVFP